MGFLDGLGDLVNRIPYVGETINSGVNGIANFVSPVVNGGMGILTGITSLTQGLMKATGNIASGLANIVNSPSFIYIIMGGVVIVAVIVSQNGGKLPIPRR